MKNEKRASGNELKKSREKEMKQLNESGRGDTELNSRR